MTQILVLTNSFITANRSHLNHLENQGVVDSITGDILSNPGTTDWGTIPTSLIPSDWDFGLSSGDGIDPYKLSRLSNRSLTSMQLDYDTILNGLDINDKTYQIELYNTIDAKINNIDITALPSANITGNVTQNQRPIYKAEVSIFAIDHSNYNVSQAQATTDSNGNYFSSMTITNGGSLTNTHITFIVIAKFGVSSQDAVIQRIEVGPIPPTAPTDDSRISVFENADSETGYTVDIKTSRNTVDAVLTSFYPGIDSTTLNSTQIPLGGGAPSVYNGDDIWSYDDFIIPNSGLAVILLFEIDLTEVTHVGILNFPTALDNKISNIISPVSIPNAVSSVSIQSIVVRGIIMNFKITIWEV
jgi:hypothetical protein